MNKFVAGFVTFLGIVLLWGAFQLPPGTQDVLALTPTVSEAALPVCSPQVCLEGDWQQWIIVTPESAWTDEELVMLDEILTAVITSLNQQGLNGRTLLSGYRFRRQPGEYVTGHQGRIAVVNHDWQEITLADAAFKRLHGFYIIHELGHVVDQHTNRQLSATFHAHIGSDLQNQATATGFWLNLPAENDLEEATADAFALWIMSIYSPGYRPVFAFTPVTTDYEGIQVVLAIALGAVAQP